MEQNSWGVRNLEEVAAADQGEILFVGDLPGGQVQRGQMVAGNKAISQP